MPSLQHFERLLGIICSVFDAHSAVLFLPTENKNAFLAAHFSLGDAIDTSITIEPGQGLVGWILRNQEPILVNNFNQRRSKLGYYANNEESVIKAFMGCQIKGGGCLCIDSKRQYSFSDKDLKILNLFAELASLLLIDSTKHAQETALARYYAALKQVYVLRSQFSRWSSFLKDFLEIMALTLGFDYVLFTARDGKGDNYILEGENRPLFITKNDKTTPTGNQLSVPIGSGLIGWVFREGTPIYTANDIDQPLAPLLGKGFTSPPFYSTICIPVIINKITRGVVCFAHGAPMVITEDMKGFIQVVIDYLTIFLENLYLKSKLKEMHSQIPTF